MKGNDGDVFNMRKLPSLEARKGVEEEDVIEYDVFGPIEG